MAGRLRASWGINGTCNAVSGVVVSISGRSEGSVYTETDENGAICGVYIYDLTHDINCDIQVKANTAIPRIGSSVTIGGYSGFIKGAEYTEQNTSYCKIHITASAFKNVTEAIVTN